MLNSNAVYKFHYDFIIQGDQKNFANRISNCNYAMIKQLIKRHSELHCYVTINSKYINGLHLPFYDFDDDDGDLDKESMLDKILNYIEMYHADGILFETLHGYHFIANRLLPFESYLNSFNHIDCCEGFKNCTAIRHYASLRIGNKYEREADKIYRGYISYDHKEHPLCLALQDYIYMYNQLANMHQ